MQQSQHPHQRKRAINGPRQHSLGWLILAIVLMFATMLAQQTYASSSTPEDAEAGLLYLRSSEGDDQRHSRYQQALHLRTNVEIDVKGLTAAVVVKQEFTNTSTDWMEGKYVFPLPENSAVNAMQLTVGNRTIIGKIEEKEQAQKIYNDAKNTGHKAALVSQERPNIFTQSVANIAPGETVTVELRYLQNLGYDQGVFSLRFPMTLTPRYIPGQPVDEWVTEQRFSNNSSTGWAMPTALVPDADHITPRYLPSNQNLAAGTKKALENTVQISVNLNAGFPLTNVISTSHNIDVTMPARGVRHIRLAKNAVTKMDRDFELRWRPVNSANAQAAIFHEQQDGDSFIQLMLLPPHTNTAGKALPRDLVLVVDTSGSMRGPSIQQAKQSLLWALDQLKPQDSFNIIAFESVHRSLYPASVTASNQHIEAAKRFVRSLQASGGTEMAPAIEAALQPAAREPDMPEPLKQVVFVTDGSVGNEAQLFKLIDDNLGSARLFTVGIGAAPNSYFMRKAAAFGRGTFTHIGDTHQVEERMGSLFQKLSSPVMAGVEVHWPNAQGVEMFPAVIPDLYLGEPLLINAKIAGGIQSDRDITVFGSTGNKAWRRHVSVPQDNAGTPVIATQWAREKIAVLLDEKIKGRSEDDVRRDVLAVALPFQLMSPYTSFVAVEEKPSRPYSEQLMTEPLLNHLPAGQSAPALMYPQTATSASFNLLSGLLALGLLWVIRRGLGDA